MRLWVFCNKYNIIREDAQVKLSTGSLNCIRRVNDVHIGISCFGLGLRKLMCRVSIDSGDKYLLEFEAPDDLDRYDIKEYYRVVDDDVMEYLDIPSLPASSLRAEYTITYRCVLDKTVFWEVCPVTVPNDYGTINMPIIVSGYGRVGIPGFALMSPQCLQSDYGAKRIEVGWTIQEALDCANATLNFNILRMAADNNVELSSFGTVKVQDILPKHDEYSEVY